MDRLENIEKSMDLRPQPDNSLKPGKGAVSSALHNEEIVRACQITGWTRKRILAHEQDARARAWVRAKTGGHSKTAQLAANEEYKKYYPFRRQFGETAAEWRTRLNTLAKDGLSLTPVPD